MKTLVVGFSKPIKPTLYAKVIMWVDKTPYDHVYIKWNWASIERDVIYQASKLSVNFESNITFESHATIIEEYEIPISDDCHRAVMQFCMDNSNKPYGIKEIIGFGYVKLCNFMGLKVNNPFPTYNNSYICSKIAADILVLAKSVTLADSPDNIDPLDLNNIIKASGFKQTR